MVNEVIFLFISGTNYVIRWIEPSTIDLDFINKSVLIKEKYPFKWYFFVNKIISDKRICYFKDTTGIIQIKLIKPHKLIFFLEILNIYLEIGVIKKIIYKKEFLIIHFHPQFHMEYLTDHKLLLATNLYKLLQNEYKEQFKIHFGAILTYQNTKKIIDIVLEKENKVYLFDSSNDLNYKLDDKIIKVHLYEFLSANYQAKDDVFLFKLTDNNTDLKEQIKKLL